MLTYLQPKLHFHLFSYRYKKRLFVPSVTSKQLALTPQYRSNFDITDIMNSIHRCLKLYEEDKQNVISKNKDKLKNWLPFQDYLLYRISKNNVIEKNVNEDLNRVVFFFS